MTKSNPRGMDGSGQKGSGSMLSGLKRTNPPGMDSSGDCKGGSVDSETTRSDIGKGGTAPGPGTREA